MIIVAILWSMLCLPAILALVAGVAALHARMARMARMEAVVAVPEKAVTERLRAGMAAVGVWTELARARRTALQAHILASGVRLVAMAVVGVGACAVLLSLATLWAWALPIVLVVMAFQPKSQAEEVEAEEQAEEQAVVEVLLGGRAVNFPLWVVEAVEVGAREARPDLPRLGFITPAEAGAKAAQIRTETVPTASHWPPTSQGTMAARPARLLRPGRALAAPA